MKRRKTQDARRNTKFCLLAVASLAIISLLGLGYWNLNSTYGDQEALPIIIDGDTVEYSADAKEVTAQGNVVITYKDTRMTCDKIVVNTQTKDGEAFGNVRLQDPRGILEAEGLTYNFQTKKGRIRKAKLRSSPYYYFGNEFQSKDENQYEALDGYFSSCNYDQPHFRMKSKRIEIYPDDKIVAHSNSLYWRKIPFFYFPLYSHSLKDPFMKVQFKAGKSGDWGPYLLSAWRSDLNPNARLRLYQDFREKLGSASGFGLNYDTRGVGKGDLKFYYTQERPKEENGGLKQESQRYMVRLRHMWALDPSTKLIAEYYRIDDDRRAWDDDADFLKDYFYREYEKDMQPKSYVLLTRSLPNSNINMLIQKRTNRWYDDMTEKLPEISYDLPSYKIGRSPLYFKNQTKFSNLANKYTAPSEREDDVVRFDTYNQINYPTRFAFLNLNPYTGMRQTAYSKDKFGNSLSPRTAFYTGIDMSTKFYRIFGVKSNFLKLDIDGLRHVISPKIKYDYIHQPTVSRSKLQEFDDIDTIAGDNRFTLALENKLQTKREEKTVDLAIFRVSSDYVIYSNQDGISKAQDRFTDFLFDLELVPFAWLRMEADAAYDHRQDCFKTVNLDTWVNIAQGCTFGLGHRYERAGGKELTSQLVWRINPKWGLRIYERYQFAASRGKGLREQEYSISRDLHCATMDINFNIKKGDDRRREESIWCVFNLKLFKESEFDYAQSYHPPKGVESRK
jgi:LPS-assembly protein